jgi:hypothetical protein
MAKQRSNGGAAARQMNEKRKRLFKKRENETKTNVTNEE